MQRTENYTWENKIIYTITTQTYESMLTYFIYIYAIHILYYIFVSYCIFILDFYWNKNLPGKVVEIIVDILKFYYMFKYFISQ